MITSTDRIEKRVFLRAPRDRVWRAIITPEEFGAWFRVEFDGAFAEGAAVRGHITYPAYGHLTKEMVVERIEPVRLFAYRWHPAAIAPKVDYSSELMTLVEFHFEDAPGGTLLKIVESGFDRIPLARRPDAFRMNEGGWAEQAENIE